MWTLSNGVGVFTFRYAVDVHTQQAGSCCSHLLARGSDTPLVSLSFYGTYSSGPAASRLGSGLY